MITIYRELPMNWKSVNLKVYMKVGMGPYYVDWNKLKQPEVRPLKFNDTETSNFWAFQWHINEVLMEEKLSLSLGGVKQLIWFECTKAVSRLEF